MSYTTCPYNHYIPTLSSLYIPYNPDTTFLSCLLHPLLLTQHSYTLLPPNHSSHTPLKLPVSPTSPKPTSPHTLLTFPTPLFYCTPSTYTPIPPHPLFLRLLPSCTPFRPFHPIILYTSVLLHPITLTPTTSPTPPGPIEPSFSYTSFTPYIAFLLHHLHPLPPICPQAPFP